MFEYLVSSWWNYLGRNRSGVALLEEVHHRVGFEVSEDLHHFQYALSDSCLGF